MAKASHRLTVQNHDRDAAGLTYVYPVVSRRARGVSVGINLNPNNACNWRCVYCQVEGLNLGKGPKIDLPRLRDELRQMLDSIVNGDFMERAVVEELRNLRDVAFSGNGEPTSSPQFAEAVSCVTEVLEEFGLSDRLPIVLITNGSLIERVGPALDHLARHGGVVWFKLDTVDEARLTQLNQCHETLDERLRKLRFAANHCPTWLQTCLFEFHGKPPSEAELEGLLGVLSRAQAERWGVEGVHLYTLARPSFQPEAKYLAPVDKAFLEALAERVKALGLAATVSA